MLTHSNPAVVGITTREGEPLKRIREKEERLAEEIDSFDLTEEQHLTVDRIISSCNESGALYGKMTYQQGFRDCAALLLEIGMIKDGKMEEQA